MTQRECDFRTGTDPHQKQRPRCERGASLQIQVGDDSWLHVCKTHMWAWAKFNGAQWLSAGKPPLPPIGE